MKFMLFFSLPLLALMGSPQANAAVCKVGIIDLEQIEVKFDTDVTTQIRATFRDGKSWQSFVDTKVFEANGIAIPVPSWGRFPTLRVAAQGGYELDVTEDGYWGTYKLDCRD